jgi:hypothetical protein
MVLCVNICIPELAAIIRLVANIRDRQWNVSALAKAYGWGQKDFYVAIHGTKAELTPYRKNETR